MILKSMKFSLRNILINKNILIKYKILISSIIDANLTLIKLTLKKFAT